MGEFPVPDSDVETVVEQMSAAVLEKQLHHVGIQMKDVEFVPAQGRVGSRALPHVGIGFKTARFEAYVDRVRFKSGRLKCASVGANRRAQPRKRIEMAIEIYGAGL